MVLVYVSNKAGLTGQTVPGRESPAIGRTWARMSWPRPNRFLPGLETCSFLLPPHERVLAKLGRHGRTWTIACRGFGLPALLLGLARNSTGYYFHANRLRESAISVM